MVIKVKTELKGCYRLKAKGAVDQYCYCFNIKQVKPHLVYLFKV